LCVCTKRREAEGDGGGDYRRRGKISYLGDVRTVKRCTRKRKGETGDLGQRSREKASG